ncbi:hypothetical protein NC653_000622 [Populus alba x Populus x berolinensis]|uniref:Uncharacterized protein n=1 Tax=Populus alba x Populus x berolinensis TaxID=444605 RepID=A0AAD6RJH1_9ROSI|nr:hypothetical protein NC653_000622 [Populus alba x Populus x berolinensis]
MRAVLVRWRLVCGMGLEKRKVMAGVSESVSCVRCGLEDEGAAARSRWSESV